MASMRIRFEELKRDGTLLAKKEWEADSAFFRDKKVTYMERVYSYKGKAYFVSGTDLYPVIYTGQSIENMNDRQYKETVEGIDRKGVKHGRCKS